MFLVWAFLLASLAGSGAAHFLLKLPKGLGYQVNTVEVAPCGGFEFDGLVMGNNLSTTGFPFAAIGTHWNTTYTVSLRLFQDSNATLVDILPPLYVTAPGSFCIPNVSVRDEYRNKLAEFHVTQYHQDGLSYQCAMIQFVDNLPASNASFVDCKNSTGVIAAFQPWGSNITTTPTPIETPGAGPTGGSSDDDDSSGSTTTGSSLWLYAVMASVALVSLV